MRNHVKDSLKNGKTTVGVWMSIMYPESVRAVADAGFDWVLFDTEHSPYDVESAYKMIQFLKGAQALPLIRVVWNDINAIKKALDTGAYGVVVPWVSSKEEAVNAVRYCRYPPEGLRGAAPGTPSSFWGISKEEYLDTANDEVMVIVQIETEKAVKNIEDIVSVEGVDATFIGPMDLSISMGYKGKPFHPKVMQAMEKVLEASKNAGVTPGIAYGTSVEQVNQFITQGFRFIGVGVDLSLLTEGCKNILSQIKR